MMLGGQDRVWGERPQLESNIIHHKASQPEAVTEMKRRESNWILSAKWHRRCSPRGETSAGLGKEAPEGSDETQDKDIPHREREGRAEGKSTKSCGQKWAIFHLNFAMMTPLFT